MKFIGSGYVQLRPASISGPVASGERQLHAEKGEGEGGESAPADAKK